MKSFDDLLSAAKVSDIMHKKDKDDNKIVWALAIIGAIAADDIKLSAKEEEE